MREALLAMLAALAIPALANAQTAVNSQSAGTQRPNVSQQSAGTTSENMKVLAQVLAQQGVGQQFNQPGANFGNGALQNGALPNGAGQRNATGGGGGAAARAQAQINANAQQLINIIQTNVSPRTWDVNGGQGTIAYYGNFQALVIRAPQEVHGQVGNTLNQLRK